MLTLHILERDVDTALIDYRNTNRLVVHFIRQTTSRPSPNLKCLFFSYEQDNGRFPNLSVHMLSMFTNKACDNEGQALLLSHMIGQSGTCMDNLCPS